VEFFVVELAIEGVRSIMNFLNIAVIKIYSMKSKATQTTNFPQRVVPPQAQLVFHPERTIEWLGGVNYEKLQSTLDRVKILMQEKPNDEIQLVINSYGGCTGIGMSFYDAVRSWLRPNLITIGTGDVDSSGVLIFLAGKRRYLTKNTTMLLHLAGRTFEGDRRFSTKDMSDMLNEDKLKDYQYACVIADATAGKSTPESILALMARNTIITSEEAVRMGLAHKVL
jgi:ATP-dependent Clp protease, protease subunit